MKQPTEYDLTNLYTRGAPLLASVPSNWTKYVPFAVFLSIVVFIFYRIWLASKRRHFIATYHWPPGLIAQLQRDYPNLTSPQIERIEAGLKQFFLAYLRGGSRYVSMPSVAADALWHHFILHTREYEVFCRTAFGRFLHHRPAAVLMRNQKTNNEGLRRSWWHCCKIDGINPAAPLTLPLLFALDRDLAIPGGHEYHPDCEALRRDGVYDGHCGGAFLSITFDGGTDGFGDGSGGDSGGGDGGGCGGD